MKVIVILGLPLSGKTTHAKAVKDEYKIHLVETGTYVYKEVEERGLTATPENIKKIAGECKAKSDSYFTEKALEHVLEESNCAPAVFLSGVKAQSEVDYLKQRVGEDNVCLVSFHACVKTRHSRLLNEDRVAESNSRGGKGKEDKAMAHDRSKFNLRDDKELGYGLGDLMALADYVVNTEDILWPYNNFETTLAEFKKILNEIINK